MRAARKFLFALLAVLGVLLCSVPARAEFCVVAANDLAFGIYDIFSPGPLDSSTTLRVSCLSWFPPGVDYEIELSTGQAGSFNTRAMTNGTSQLNYNLYTNASRTTTWGDGTSGTSIITEAYSLPSFRIRRIDYRVYGRVFSGQSVTSGTYLDTITVTVIF